MEGSAFVEEIRLPPETRAVVEHLAKRLNADAGRWRLTVELEDGHVRFVSREEFRIPATGLERFDRELPP